MTQLLTLVLWFYFCW